MNWIVLAIVAQFLSAITVFIDKYVLVYKKGIRHPVAYTFFTALLSGAVVVLVPLGLVSWPTAPVALLSIGAAVLYLASLIFLYCSLRLLSVTDVIPITGAVGAITTGLLAASFLTHDIPPTLVPPFVLLTLGTFMIYCFCFPVSVFLMTVASGALVGASTFLVKLVFETGTPFWTALFWPLFMNALVACALIAPIRWMSIRDAFAESSHAAKGMAILSKSLGGLAFVLTAVAISLGSVSIVSAMGGLQLVFILILAVLFAHRVPGVFRAEMRVDRLVLKIGGTVAIVLGLATLFLPVTWSL